MKTYINDKGQTILIAEMPDAYLLNAYAKQKKRLDELRKKVQSNSSLVNYIGQTLNSTEQLVRDMLDEIHKRNLI